MVQRLAAAGGAERFVRRFAPAVLLLITLASMPCLSVRAAEALETLVVSGDWTAEEQQSATAADEDVCIAFTADANTGFGLRATSDDFEISYSQNNWALPANVTGNLVIAVGPYRSVFPVTGNTSDTAVATVSAGMLHRLIAATEKAVVMTVQAGTAPPQKISLHGSNRATTSFLRCAARVEAAGRDDWIKLTP